jgi:uncharacterized NAD(P)/FAD-binding protein YdhS
MEVILQPDILIVGGGSRALLLLERLASLMVSQPGRTLHITVAEPGALGPGIHRMDLPPYITFNTPITCPTIFVNQLIPSLASSISGPSLAEWLPENSHELSADFLPRAIVGRYLSWSAQHLLKHLPSNMKVEHLAESIVQVARTSGGLTFQTEAAKTITPRAAVLAVGHGFGEAVAGTSYKNGGDPAWLITNPIPTHVQLRNMDGRHTIAIRGLGLTALDVLAELTIGRGGGFEWTGPDSPPRYIPSGEEPRIYMFSRSSCPIRARPHHSGGTSSGADLVFLEERRAAELLSKHNRIEFRTEVFPLILAEMTHRFVKRWPAAGSPQLPAIITKWFADGYTGRSNEEIGAFFLSPNVLAPLSEIMRPILRSGMPGTSEAAMVFLRDDIRESRKGFSGSPLKYALEVLIESRIFVKSLVDFNYHIFSDGPWIYRTFSSLVNRNTIGPKHEKSAELLSLLSSGIVQIAPALSTATARNGRAILNRTDLDDDITVDYLIRADQMNCDTSKHAGFVRNLLSLGLALPIQDAKGALVGIKVDRNMKLLSPDQCSNCPLWAIGPVCEGSSYYNNYIPCIQQDAKYPFFEANEIANGIVDWLFRNSELK